MRPRLPKSSVAEAARGILSAAPRRLAAVGWRGSVLAAAALIASAAVFSALGGPGPAASPLFFSGATGGDDLKGSGGANSSSIGIKAPPLDSEELAFSTDTNESNSPGDEPVASPLDSEAPRSSSDEIVPPLSATEKFSTNLQPEVPALSTTTDPPFLGPITSTGPINGQSTEAKPSDEAPDILPSQSKEPIVLTETDWQLIYARNEISHAPIVSDDPDLHAPLFRNVSVFKRSYELMEKILKVYIYRDGDRPIFHTPVLKGIYASEGWFLKLMEGKSGFVEKNPKKAHLFYLPYNARQLEVTLYKPDSHDLKPLAIFLKNYIDGISARYPFWNRTRGADHFLVACHDWGPYTTRLHAELSRNTIKALCNADLSEGFIYGRDLSLPETLIRNPRRPLRDIGGKPISQRSILAFFAGNMHGRVRPILLNYWSGKDEDMRIYGPLPARVSRKMSYSQHMKSSKFCICPMGYEVNSPRIVEAIYHECVPVIIADNFVLPFDEVLDWSAFSIVVAEKDIPNLKDILLKVSPWQYASMHDNVKRVQRHFLWHPRPVKYDLFHMILHSIWFNRLNQIRVG